MGPCYAKTSRYELLEWIPCPNGYASMFNSADYPLEMVVKTSPRNAETIIRFRDEVICEGAPKMYLYQRHDSVLGLCDDYYIVREFPDRVHFLISEPMSRIRRNWVQFVATMFVEGQERYDFDGSVHAKSTIRSLVHWCLLQARLPCVGVKATIRLQSEPRIVSPDCWNDLIVSRIRCVKRVLEDCSHGDILLRNDINAGPAGVAPCFISEVDGSFECEGEPSECEKAASKCDRRRSRSRSR